MTSHRGKALLRSVICMCRCGFRWDVGTGTRCPWGRLPIPSHAKAPWCPRRHPLGSAACSWKPSSVCWQDMNRHHCFCDRTAPSSGVRTCGGNGLCFSASGRFSLAPFPKPCAVRSSGCSPCHSRPAHDLLETAALSRLR